MTETEDFSWIDDEAKRNSVRKAVSVFYQADAIYKYKFSNFIKKGAKD